MSSQKFLTEAFRQLTSNSMSYDIIVPGEVTAVEKTSCSVRFIKEDITIEGIRLKSTPDKKDNFMIHYPKVGSNVLVGLIDEEYEGVVLACDEVERIVFQREGTLYTCDEDNLSFAKKEGIHFSVGEKITLETGNASLKGILVALKDLIKQIAETPIPPSTGAPAGIAGLPPTPPNLPIAGKVSTLNSKIDTLLT